MRASYALKDSHCHRSSIIDFTQDQQLMSVYIYILMIYHNGIDQLKTIDQWGQRMIGHVIDIKKVKLVEAPFEHFGDKVTVFEI